MNESIGVLFHEPHGRSNAVLLPAVTRFSITGAGERYATVARTMRLAALTETDVGAGNKLVAGLTALNNRLQVPRLGGCRGLERTRFDAAKAKMAADALASGSPENNPVVPATDQIVALYDESWGTCRGGGRHEHHDEDGIAVSPCRSGGLHLPDAQTGGGQARIGRSFTSLWTSSMPKNFTPCRTFYLTTNGAALCSRREKT